MQRNPIAQPGEDKDAYKFPKYACILTKSPLQRKRTKEMMEAAGVEPVTAAAAKTV